MKISIDGGAFCSAKDRRFGTYTLSKNLLEGLSLYDTKNTYICYSFCPKPKDIALGRTIRFHTLFPKLFWMSLRVSLEEYHDRKDIFLALNQGIPLSTFSRIIGFSHGMSFYFFPHHYYAMSSYLENQLKTMVQRSSHIIVSSKKVKEELLLVYQRLDIRVLPFGIPFDMLNTPKDQTQKSRFFLFVGINHPIKNTEFIVEAFSLFLKDSRFSDYHLYVVGNFDANQYRQKNVHIMPFVDRKKLKALYEKATAYLTASYYESFNLPVLEALSQGCPVIGLQSAIIPELRKYAEVVGNQEEFVTKMKNIAKHGANMKEKMIQLQKEFSWKQYVEALVKLYEEC